MNPEDLVHDFHVHYDAPIRYDRATLDIDRLHFRMAFIAEEFAELVEAVYGPTAALVMREAFATAQRHDDETRDVVEAADALGDIVYVTYGMALECGIPLTAVLEEIHTSNLSKLGEDGRPILREDGKVLKGPNYSPPDVARVLAIPAQREASEVAA